eukprot:5239529-Pyramimonas_sp.AAC.1
MRATILSSPRIIAASAHTAIRASDHLVINPNCCIVIATHNSRPVPFITLGLDTAAVEFSHQLFTDAVCSCRALQYTPGPRRGLEGV